MTGDGKARRTLLHHAFQRGFNTARCPRQRLKQPTREAEVKLRQAPVQMTEQHIILLFFIGHMLASSINSLYLVGTSLQPSRILKDVIHAVRRALGRSGALFGTSTRQSWDRGTCLAFSES
jgi:hypothetical protein